MDDPDWMNDFKTPTEDVLMLSSSSPSSSPPRDVEGKKDKFYGAVEDKLGTNGKDESDDEDSPLITMLKDAKAVKKGLRRVGGGSTSATEVIAKSPVKKARAVGKVVEDVQDEEDDAEDIPKVIAARRSRGLKRVLESEEEDDDDEEYQTPSKSRKTSASSRVKRDGVGKTSTSGRKGKRVSFSEEEETPKLKKMRRDAQVGKQAVQEEENEEKVPLSSLVKKGKNVGASATTISETLGVDDLKVGFSATAVSAKKEPVGAAALRCLMDRGDAAVDGGGALVTKEEEKGGDVQEDETGEVSERKAKPRVTSTLPVIFAEKVHRTKVLLECEGDALDLSGDMGAVGRFSVSSGKEKGDDELLLDLKGIIYKTTIVPSNTFFVVNVGHAEAKVEAIMNDFMQLRPDINQVEDETIVEGTLEGFAFDLDNEGEPLSTPVTASAPASDSDEDADQKKKTSTKTQKAKKVISSKVGKGGRTKGSGKKAKRSHRRAGKKGLQAKSRGKGAASKKPRAKAKASTKKVKAKATAAKSIKSKKS